MMEAILKDVWILDDGSSLDLLRINTGHTNPNNNNNNNNNNTAVTAEDGDNFQNKQQDYFETVFGHRGDRRADWAGIYTQLTEEHSERYVPNRWDYTTTAELVRLNLRDTASSTSTTTPLTTVPATSSPITSNTIGVPPTTTATNLHRSVVLLDLKPQPSSEEEEGEEIAVVDDVATNIKNHIMDKCPKTSSWRRTTLTIPLLHMSGVDVVVTTTTAAGVRNDTTTSTTAVGCVPPSSPLQSPPAPIWGVVAAHPSFQMSEPTLSSIEKARRLKHSVAITSTVPINIHYHPTTCTGGGGGGIDIKVSSSCTYEVLMEMADVATPDTTVSSTTTSSPYYLNNKVNDAGHEGERKTSSSSLPLSMNSNHKGRMMDGGTPLLGRLGELGAVVFVWDDEDSLECVIPHELLVRGDRHNKDNNNNVCENGPPEPHHTDEDGAYGTRLFACRSVRRYWRHRTLPITSRTEDVVV